MTTRIFGGCLAVALTAFALLLGSPTSAQLPDYTLFESDPVRLLALSSDGSTLYAINMPDNQLMVYDVQPAGLSLVGSVGLGVDPCAVAARDNGEVWVVNQVSDSVSIIDTTSSPMRVVRTLLVGDEPRDIVFAGSAGDRAFITTAHRGQHSPYADGEYDQEGIGRADVWVFEADDLGTALGGTPLTIIELFGDKPRALAATPDGSTVYAATFHSGNQTTVMSEQLVCDGAGACTSSGTMAPGGRPAPETNFQGITSRESGLIVGLNPSTGNWEDELGRNWNDGVRINLPDLDVFEIDADAPTPMETNSIAGVGTILFNMIVNPVNGDLYVTNTDANNRVRFEGMGDWVSDLGPKPSGDPATVRGDLGKSRVTVIDPLANVFPRHLNKHINYLANPQPPGVKDASLATPTDMAISSDGSTLYVAGVGSSAIGVYDTTALKNDTFTPSAANMINLGASRGPSAVVLDEANNRLYVLTRFDNSLLSIDLATNAISTETLFNPEPPEVTAGRKFLYDAKLTGSNGEASCSSCHIFGDMDDLAWDLGDPDGVPSSNPNPQPQVLLDLPITLPLQDFDPLKGPMTTQSLRGMSNSGPMHWRGDRTGGASGGDPLDEVAAFNSFNVAFPGLVGRDEGQLTPAQMQAFTDFALQLTYPPNPSRGLDNSLSPAAAAGAALYDGRATVRFQGFDVANCNDCHTVDRSQGFFGTAGRSNFENETMEFKISHLRNAYQKIGMFGMAPNDFFPVNGNHLGDQVRGVGFLHDGSVSSVFNFLSTNVFNVNNTEQRNLEAFIIEFDTDMAPVVGQQVTLTSTSGSAVNARVDLLIERALAPFVMPHAGTVTECDLIVKGVIAGEPRGAVLQSDGTFLSDKASDGAFSEAVLRGLADVPGQELTFTCVPPGSGVRMGVDQDRDGILNADETDPGTGGPDSVAPVLTGLVARPNRVDTQAVDVDVTCEMTVTDDSAGVAEVTCSLLSPSRTVSLSCTATSPASGNVLNGVWACPLVMPQGSQLGYWSVAPVTAVDASGNSVHYDYQDMVNLGLSQSINNALPVTCSAATLSVRDVSNGALWVTFLLLGVTLRRRRARL